MHILAIDIGGTKHSLALFQDSQMTRRETFPTDTSGCDWMINQLTNLGREWTAATPVQACGIGFGGPVDFRTQRVGRSMHVGGWQDLPLASALEQALGIPCRMDNDANLGALGEYCYGAGR